MPQEKNLYILGTAFHEALPERIRTYLRQRDISDLVIDRYLLGWDDARITIPITNQTGEVVFFKLAKDPEDRTESPKMLTTAGTHAELYGWERVLAKPEQIIICEGEFDRLVLETQGFLAVTSTGGAGTFRTEWAEALREIPSVYLCFDNDEAGRQGAKRIAQLIPHARIVNLPDEVGDGGDVTDFFARLRKSREEFSTLLEAAQPLPQDELPEPRNTQLPPPRISTDDELARLKFSLRIEDFVQRYFPLQRSGQNFIGHCPFHKDHKPSFVVFPQTQTFYCFGCREHGDVITFLMRVEHLTFLEALKVLRRLPS